MQSYTLFEFVTCAIAQMAGCDLIYADHIGGRMRTAHFHFYDGTCLDREIEDTVVASYGQWENPADERQIRHSFKLREPEEIDPEGVHYDETIWG